MPQPPDKILVIRNDKLGDFTLALPSIALLKACLPACQLTVLVPAYTQDIAGLCPAIDQIIIDPGASAPRAQQVELLNTIKTHEFDAALTLYSTSRVGWLLWRSGIHNRFAPATKLAQVFHNYRLKQRRSLSQKPEYEYNLDLTRYLLGHYSVAYDTDISTPYLKTDPLQIAEIKQAFATSHQVAENSLIIFLHPGHGGSANNLSLDQYTTLANLIGSEHPLHFVISAGPGERERALQVKNRIHRHPSSLYESTEGLAQFVRHIAFADLFIGGSTGPLHVAGALNRPTCGFYTNRQSATKLRWQTLNDDDVRLAFSPPPGGDAEEMQRIDLDSAALAISKFLNRAYR